MAQTQTSGEQLNAQNWQPKKPPFEVEQILKRLRDVIGKLGGAGESNAFDEGCRMLFGCDYSGGKKPGGETEVVDPGYIAMSSWRQNPPRSNPDIINAAHVLRKYGRIDEAGVQTVLKKISDRRAGEAQEIIRLSSRNPNNTFPTMSKADAQKLASQLIYSNPQHIPAHAQTAKRG